MFKSLEDLSKYYLVLHPRMATLIISRCPNGRDNVMPASWVTPLSEEPPSLGVAIDRESYTFECIEYSKEFTVNVPSHDKIELVYNLGTISGRDVDKVSRFGLKLIRGRKVNVSVWSDAIGVIECTVEKSVDVGEVRFYIGRVVDVYVVPELMSRWGWDFTKTNIPLHGWGRTFYLVGRRYVVLRRTK